jgi:hypothetical protein
MKDYPAVFEFWIEVDRSPAYPVNYVWCPHDDCGQFYIEAVGHKCNHQE